ncbi:hypothetical protein IHE44_0013914, partial [Lamprotornis superbus]
MAEERRFRSASGVPIALRCRQHSASCRELAVRGPRLQLRSLSAATSAVWLAAYGLFAISENSMVLSAAIFITLIGLIIYLHFVKIDQESLLVIGSLGIQVTSSYASGKESTTFIEMGQVKDVVINEAIHMQKVIYYLCILLRDPEDPQGVSEVVPLFQHMLVPGLLVQKRVVQFFSLSEVEAFSTRVTRDCRMDTISIREGLASRSPACT